MSGEPMGPDIVVGVNSHALGLHDGRQFSGRLLWNYFSHMCRNCKLTKMVVCLLTNATQNHENPGPRTKPCRDPNRMHTKHPPAVRARRLWQKLIIWIKHNAKCLIKPKILNEKWFEVPFKFEIPRACWTPDGCTSENTHGKIRLCSEAIRKVRHLQFGLNPLTV